MRRLLPPDPSGGDADVASAYAGDRRPPAGRPWVLANMVGSADGAASVEGRSGGLGGPADKVVFRHLRAIADVVVAGAGTVRAERYRPVVEPTPTPVAVVTRTLDLDWTSPLFADPPARTVLLTCEAASPDARRRAAEVADVVVVGDGGVEPALAFAALAERGHRLALCEGGPTLLAQVAAAGVLDELCLTVAPLLTGGDAPRVLTGPLLAPSARLELVGALEEGSTLLLRYLVRSGDGP